MYIPFDGKVSSRIDRLRNRILSAKPAICLDRARCYTAVYQEFESEPVIIRRAFALQKTLEDMRIFIDPDALIVGNHSSALRAAPIFPEYAVEWIEKEIDQFETRVGDRFTPSASVKRELLEICAWWRGKTVLEKGRSLMAPELREIHETGIIRAEGNLTSGDAHIAINNEKLLSRGIQYYLDKAVQLKEQCDLTTASGTKKYHYYRATAVALKALQDFILRYADLAETQITELGNNVTLARKNELLLISENCRSINTDPPVTFYQALQLTWFVQLVLQIESNGHSMSLGRMDQYLYPFYRRDRMNDQISDDQVVELLENTWINLLSVNKIRSWSHTRYSAGSPLYQNVTIGGKNPDGSDAVNELSSLILRAVGETQLTQPNLSVRFHEGMTDQFLRECLMVVRKGFGMPAFNNDEIVIPSFIDLGVAPEDAYNYSAIGCIEVAVPGKWGYRCTGKHFINFMRVLLAALHNGRDQTSGKTFFPGNGSLGDFDSFDQVMVSWREQIQRYARAGVAIDTAIDLTLEAEAPDILCSAFVDDCLERGMTIHEGGTTYDFVSGLQVGIANLGNSLAAIRKMVFEEQRLTGDELLMYLESDFAGADGERVRQMLLNSVPKFGNDDDYVDLQLVEAYNAYIDTLEYFHTIRYGKGPIGCRYYAGTSSISANVPAGATVRATPDGRKAFTPLAEGASPTAGTDQKGPTAVFSSIGKLPTARILGGVLLNQKVSPSMFEHPEAVQKLGALLRGFFKGLHGWHVQYNVVDRDTLLDAQEHPEQYRDLVVRVAGYSAFFTNLSQEAQNDIIARTEHAIG